MHGQNNIKFTVTYSYVLSRLNEDYSYIQINCTDGATFFCQCQNCPLWTPITQVELWRL